MVRTKEEIEKEIIEYLDKNSTKKAGPGTPCTLATSIDNIPRATPMSFYNDGSTGILDSFTVTFYQDAALTQVIGKTVITPRISGIINGCSWDHPTDWASVTWSVPVGTHNFWAKIDSSNSISGETSESDNVTSGKVTIN